MTEEKKQQKEKEQNNQKRNAGPIQRLDNELMDLGNELEKMFWGNWPRMTTLIDRDTRISMVDIRDEGDQYIIEAELPGIDKEDIEIEVKRNTLEICGEKSDGEDVDDEGFFVRERSYSRFYRKIPLPEDIIPKKAKATMEDGILHLEMPKVNPRLNEEPFSVSIEK